MKNIKKFIAVIAAVGILATAGAAFAAATKTPEELEVYKTERLEQKKEVLDQRVTEGKLTQEQADEIYNAIKENQATCDGTGSAQIGKKFGAGFGSGAGKGMGQGKMGQGKGQGMGQRMGNGAGMRNGDCVMAQE